MATKVKLETTLGDIVMELDDEKAPVSCKNVLEYVESGHYAGTVFHRVINGFMIQGGGYDETLQKKPTKPAIKNEATNGLKNVRGSVAMARTPDIDSATSQFFINVVDNDFLDHRDETPEGYGYAVFGKVVDGMDIVDKIKEAETGPKGPFKKDCPKETIHIKGATRLDEGGDAAASEGGDDDAKDGGGEDEAKKDEAKAAGGEEAKAEGADEAKAEGEEAKAEGGEEEKKSE